MTTMKVKTTSPPKKSPKRLLSSVGDYQPSSYSVGVTSEKSFLLNLTGMSLLN